MHNSDLVKTLKHLSHIERRQLRKAVRSPFFNHREDVVKLCDVLLRAIDLGGNLLDREKVFSKVFPDEQDIDMPRLRCGYISTPAVLCKQVKNPIFLKQKKYWNRQTGSFYPKNWARCTWPV